MANDQGQQTRAQNLLGLRAGVIKRKNQLLDEFQSLIVEETRIDAKLASIQADTPKSIPSSSGRRVRRHWKVG